MSIMWWVFVAVFARGNVQITTAIPKTSQPPVLDKNNFNNLFDSNQLNEPFPNYMNNKIDSISILNQSLLNSTIQSNLNAVMIIPSNPTTTTTTTTTITTTTTTTTTPEFNNTSADRFDTVPDISLAKVSPTCENKFNVNLCTSCQKSLFLGPSENLKSCFGGKIVDTTADIEKLKKSLDSFCALKCDIPSAQTFLDNLQNDCDKEIINDSKVSNFTKNILKSDVGSIVDLSPPNAQFKTFDLTNQNPISRVFSSENLCGESYSKIARIWLDFPRTFSLKSDQLLKMYADSLQSLQSNFTAQCEPFLVGGSRRGLGRNNSDANETSTRKGNDQDTKINHATAGNLGLVNLYNCGFLIYVLVNFLLIDIYE
ncbi:hypothetical protein G9A89_009866 [Geosiphon pyriformis]|nr:hypothetical protein G9A89_009866 [Geosiphon pyriformis]